MGNVIKFKPRQYCFCFQKYGAALQVFITAPSQRAAVRRFKKRFDAPWEYKLVGQEIVK